MAITETKVCQNCKASFGIDASDFAFYGTMHVPPPTWCPECRMLRRMGWTGYRILYKRKCDFTGDNVITFYHPETPHRIYRQDIWWSDMWDPKSYGRDYDFSRPFFEQFGELLREVPLPALHTDYASMVNSDYCNGAAGLKNCYLCFQAGGTGVTEGCAYAQLIDESRDCFDFSFSNKCELCYEVVRAERCYRTLWSLNCEDCQDTYFSRDCVGCSHCIGCVNLRKKSYCIFNRQYAKERYYEELEKFDFGSSKNVAEFKKRVQDFMVTAPRRAFSGRKNTNCSGDYILNSKNVRDSYMVTEGENVRYAQSLKSPTANCYDHTLFGVKAEWVYESAWAGLSVHTIKFSFWNYHAHHLEYSFGCHGSENLFGCVGVRKGTYCILNKQYSKSEYHDLVGRIKRQMADMPYRDSLDRTYRYGEFFPPDMSPWTFDETMGARGFLDISKEQAVAGGFKWRDPDPREYKDATITLPDHIKDVPDTVIKEILKCEQCGKNYQIIAMEFRFYRTMNVPIPRLCPLCRDRGRTMQLNPIKIFDRTCMKCGTALQTSYAPDRPEVVYCESCYQAEVV